ncbi:MAG: hypothetical protein JSV04_06630 [Candidatus Heimdallarchaeota archaeon]|nr:MAG: hypothetical protein JSV04_06630 [Candidatus Heimdallarchaeota archaeon]
MSNTTNYNPWFAEQLKNLIELIANQSPQDQMNTQISEIQRGVEYGTNHPGSINDLLLKIGRNLIDSLQVYYRQQRQRSPTGVPPGGQATLLAGTEGELSGAASQQFSVDELKGALASRKKEKVVKKMKGSLDLLKEFDED